MKKTAKRLMIVLIIVLCACVFPISLVRKSDTIDFAMNTDYYVISDSDIKDFKQTFIALTSYLDEIAFDVGIPGEISGEENLVICIREEKSRKILLEKTVSIQDVNDQAYTFIPVKKWIHKGGLYSLSVTVEGLEGISVVYSTETTGIPADQILYFGGEPVQGQAVLRCVYTFPLNIKNVLCLWGFVLTVGLALLEILTHEEPGRNNAIIKKINELLDKYQIPILLTEFGVILLLVIRICRNEAVDWDEAYTWMLVTKHNIPDMLRTTAADVHPPLYYLLVKAAMGIFGESIFAAKMVSVAGMSATCLLGITLIRKRFGFKAASLFLPVAGLGTQLLYFNVNVRMYSWMIFFVLAAGLAAYEIIRNGRGKWWIAFTLSALGGIYTQYFAVVPLFFMYLFLLIWFVIQDRRQIKKWLGCCLATVAGYAPWLTVVIDTLRRDSANAVEEKAEGGFGVLCEWAFQSNIKFSEYMPIVMFAAAIIFLLLEWKKYGRAEKAFLVLSGALFWLSYGVCMLLVSQMHHFWHNRYLVDALLFIWLFIIVVLSRRSIAVWSAAVVWLGISVMSSYVVIQAKELNTIPWTQQAKQLLSQVQDQEKIVYTFVNYDIFYQYWLPDAELVWYEDVELDEMGGEFYVIAWGGRDFSRTLYEDGTLKKEILGQMRLEEGVVGVELWKISVRPQE